MDVQDEDEDNFERDFLRNRKRYSAVFQLIYCKYNREFDRDERGGNEVTIDDYLDFTEEEEAKEGMRIKGKQLSSCDLLDSVSSESEEDLEMTALLHQKVIQIKKEISWDEEEQRDKERSRLKATARRRRDTSSSSSESEHSDSDGGPGRLRQRKRKRRLSTHRQEREDVDEAGPVGDGSETLYETEYFSEYDPSHVHSDPEESGNFTPPRCMVDRDAYSTPRAVRRCRHHSSLIRGSVVRELGKSLSNPIDIRADPNATQTEDEIVSGYDTASGYHSGPGELFGRPNSQSSESDTLEYVGTPPLPCSGSPIKDILCAPPAISSSFFDENLSVVVHCGEKPQGLKKEVENSTSNDLLDSKSVKQEKEDVCSVAGCTCNQEDHMQENGWGVGTKPPSADMPQESCDSHVSVINNVFRDVTYISYGHCGHAVNRPSCFRCCAVQSCNTYCPYHNPHYPCSHPSHYHSSHCHPSQLYTSYMPPCKPEPTSNLVGPQFNPAVPINNLCNPTFSKRKLDSEQSDPSCNCAAPLPKKQCC